MSVGVPASCKLVGRILMWAIDTRLMYLPIRFPLNEATSGEWSFTDVGHGTDVKFYAPAGRPPSSGWLELESPHLPKGVGGLLQTVHAHASELLDPFKLDGDPILVCAIVFQDAKQDTFLSGWDIYVP